MSMESMLEFKERHRVALYSFLKNATLHDEA